VLVLANDAFNSEKHNCLGQKTLSVLKALSVRCVHVMHMVVKRFLSALQMCNDYIVAYYVPAP